MSDSGLVALVERPLLDALGACQTRLAQNLHVFARGRLAYAKLACNQASANPILHQIAIDLRREVLGRVLKLLKNLQPALVRESPDCDGRYLSQLPNYYTTQ